MLNNNEILEEFERRFLDCEINIVEDYEHLCVVQVSTGILSCRVGAILYENVGTIQEFAVDKTSPYLDEIVDNAVRRIGRAIAHNIQVKSNNIDLRNFSSS